MNVLLLSQDDVSPPDILPALGLLGHSCRLGHPSSAATEAEGCDVVLMDARTDLVQARSTCRLLLAAGPEAPVLAVLTEGGLTAVDDTWGLDDLLLVTAGPAEVETRLRLAVARAGRRTPTTEEPGVLRVGELVIEEDSYTARVRDRPLDLTYKEFELLRFLAQSPGRVYSRAQLLQEVWGYDYYGGTRTVDVHVRRLRAKLGPEHETTIGTVRHVGYKFVKPSDL